VRSFTPSALAISSTVSPCFLSVRARAGAALVVPERLPLYTPALSGKSDADSLTLLRVLQFDFGNAKQEAGYQMSNRAAKINLLRNGDDPHSMLAPVGQHVDAFLKTSRQAVQFPHHNGVNLSGKDGRLQFLESVTLKACAALLILKPLRVFMPVTLQPRFQLGALAVGLLAFGGRYADIDAGAHAKMGTP
jgi:hypothetical protein